MAGLVLASSRAFQVGDALTVRSWAFGGVEYGGRVSDLTLTHTVLRGEAGTIKVPNARFLDATLTLHPSGASGVTLRLPVGVSLEQLQAVVAGRAEVLPLTLSADGWEVTLYCPEASGALFQDLERLLRAGTASSATDAGAVAGPRPQP